MPANVTGKKPGELCPGCKEGRLAVRTSEHGSGGGIGGAFYSRTVIAHLVCESCCGMYEAVDRGKAVKSILEAQLQEFENPAEMPTTCQRCEGAIVEKMSGDPEFAIRTRFRSCETCLTVTWVFPEQMLREIDDLFPHLSGQRMPSPPISGGRPRRE